MVNFESVEDYERRRAVMGSVSKKAFLLIVKFATFWDI